MALDRLKGRRDKQMPPRSASCEVAHGPRQLSLSVVAQPSELLTDSKPLHRNRCAPFDLRPKGIAIVAACENDQGRGAVAARETTRLNSSQSSASCKPHAASKTN